MVDIRGHTRTVATLTVKRAITMEVTLIRTGEMTRVLTNIREVGVILVKEWEERTTSEETIMETTMETSFIHKMMGMGRKAPISGAEVKIITLTIIKEVISIIIVEIITMEDITINQIMKAMVI
jgi:hypothetical protein